MVPITWHLTLLSVTSSPRSGLLRGGDLDADLRRRLTSDAARRGEACIELSDDDEVDCGRFHFDEDDGREELDRVPCFTTTAASAATALPPVAAVSGCESDDGAKVAG